MNCVWHQQPLLPSHSCSLQCVPVFVCSFSEGRLQVLWPRNTRSLLLDCQWSTQQPTPCCSAVNSRARCASAIPRFLLLLLLGEVRFPLSAYPLGRKDKKNHPQALSSTPLHDLCRLCGGHSLSTALSRAPWYCALLHGLVGQSAQTNTPNAAPLLRCWRKRVSSDPNYSKGSHSVGFTLTLKYVLLLRFSRHSDLLAARGLSSLPPQPRSMGSQPPRA